MKAAWRNVSALVLCAVAGCRAQGPPKASLTAEEAGAVRAAEAFVRDNGYTSEPAVLSAVQWDVVEAAVIRDAGVPAEKLLAWRRNSIHGKAFGISRGQEHGEAGWTVVFLRAKGGEPEKRPTGVAVVMDSRYESMRKMHLDIFLDGVEKVLQGQPRE